MRDAIARIATMGNLTGVSADVPSVELWQHELEQIIPPITDDELQVLLNALPADEDDCYGLAWMVLHSGPAHQNLADFSTLSR